MAAVVCPSCWAWYPDGTTRCRQCRVKLGSEMSIRGDTPRGKVRTRAPEAVPWVRRALMLQSATSLALLGYATTGDAAAERTYGPTLALRLQPLIHAAQSTRFTALAAVAAISLIALGIQLLLARWIGGRMLLLFFIGAPVYFVVINAAVDTRFLQTTAGFATTALTAAALIWSIARPTAH